MKTQIIDRRPQIVFFVAILSFVLFCPHSSRGEGPSRITLETTSPQKIRLTVGKSVIIQSKETVKRVSVGAPEVADALVLTSRQISLTGKAPGITNMTLWDIENKVSAVLDLEVSPDISRLEEMIHKILPEEKNVLVTATHDNITLSGTVSSLSRRDQILALAEPYFPKKVVNLLKVETSGNDLSRLEKMLRQVFPEETDIKVTATDDNVVLSGVVSSKGRGNQIQLLAESYFPKRVVNLLKVETSSNDFSRLEKMLRQVFPEETDIKVTAADDNVVLSGVVSSKERVNQIQLLAESYFPQRIVNLLQFEVPTDVSVRLKEMFYQVLPEEKDIKVIATHDNVTLAGTVSSTGNLSQVLKLAESYFPKEATEKTGSKIINLLEVSGVHQVMLEVRVAEMSRSLLKRLGFNFAYLSHGNFGLSLLKNLTSLPSQGFPGNPLGVSNNVNAIFRWVNGSISWTVFVDALREDGLLKILAEPTLITLSGKTANFLAGGEFPVPVPQSGLTNTITVEYKPFGVGLNFTPTVLSSNKINMQVAPEVSELDFANAISISGFLIPSLTTRRVSTTIELADGQSFAIAGLLKDEVREVVTRFPLLGDIPILGALFRSSNFQKNETELVVIVTPHLVKPLDMAKQTLPTDQFIEPDDFEFYLLGNLEGKGQTKPSSNPVSSINRKGEWRLEGSFGHIIPK